MTFEKLKELIDNEDYLVRYDNQFVWEYHTKDEKISYPSGLLTHYSNNAVYDMNGSEHEVQDEIDNILIEVFKYTELDVTFENILKVIKNQQSGKFDYVVFHDAGWGEVIDDLEEELMDNGACNIGNILKLKVVKL